MAAHLLVTGAPPLTVFLGCSNDCRTSTVGLSSWRMDPISRKLGQALLDHHRNITQQYPPGPKLVKDKYTIAYSTLCVRANVPLGILPIIGRYLLPIAEWCESASYPALNSLAVNGDTGIPGDGYDEAGGFKIIHWPAEVERCIRYTAYPTKMP